MPRKKGSLNKFSKNDDNFQRTTIRLPRDLYDLLKFNALVEDKSAETIIEEALWDKFKSINTFDTPSDWGDDLAEFFLQSLPTPCSIKDKQAKIIWVNLSYEALVGKTLSTLKGKNLFSFDFIDDEIEKEKVRNDIEMVFQTQKPMEAYESMVINERGLLFRTQRFLFGNNNEFLGDISFDEFKLRKHRWEINDNQLIKLAATIKKSKNKGLFTTFLDEAPIAIALKRPIENSKDTEIIWANKQFKILAYNYNEETSSLEDFNIFKERTMKVFGLSENHEILKHENAVLTNKKAECWSETLPRWTGEKDKEKRRKSLRFPIFDRNGNVKFIGIVSANFQRNDESTEIKTLSASA